MKYIKLFLLLSMFAVLSCSHDELDTAFDRQQPVTTDYPITKRVFYDEFLAQGEILEGMTFSELGFYISEQQISEDCGGADKHSAEIVSGQIFQSWVGGLAEDTDYYVRAYGIGTDGERYIGEMIKVRTSSEHIEYVKIGEVEGSGESINARSQKVVGNVVDFGNDADGVIEYGAYVRRKDADSDEWSSKASFFPDKGTIKEEVPFDVIIEGLEPETEYEYCVYARNNRKEQLSNVSTFTTAGTVLPTVRTDGQGFEVATTKIVASGTVEDNGNDPQLEVGFYIGTDQGTMSERIVSTDLSDNGVFSGSKRGLTKETTYYIKSFARNYSGEACGEVISVTTKGESVPEILPDAYTYEQILSNVTENSVTLRGYLESDGGMEITSTGVYWGESPDRLDNKVTGALSGEYGENLEVTVSGLSSGQIVYYKFFAVNEQGEALSSLESIGTKLVVNAWENAGTNVDAGLPNPWIRLSTTVFDTYYELPPVTVTEADGKKYKYYFLDRNLGATKVAESASISNNMEMMGSIYIYSYPKPGSVPSTGPGAQQRYGYQICTGNPECLDWNNPEYSPCPADYLIPTRAEWSALVETLPEEDRNLTGVFNLIKVGKTGRRPQNGGIFQKTIQYATLFCADADDATGKRAVFQARDTDSDADFAGDPYIAIGTTRNMINNGVAVSQGVPVRCFRKMAIPEE